jgi:hypothetical protein
VNTVGDALVARHPELHRGQVGHRVSHDVSGAFVRRSFWRRRQMAVLPASGKTVKIRISARR